MDGGEVEGEGEYEYEDEEQEEEKEDEVAEVVKPPETLQEWAQFYYLTDHVQIGVAVLIFCNFVVNIVDKQLIDMQSDSKRIARSSSASSSTSVFVHVVEQKNFYQKI